MGVSFARPLKALSIPNFLKVVLFALFVSAGMAARADVDLVVNNSDSVGGTLYDPVANGGTMKYEVRVANNGTTPATGVVLTDTLPANSTFVSAVPSQGSCNAPAGGTLTCNLGGLNGSGAATASVLITLQAAAQGIVHNIASAVANEPDADNTNDTNIDEATTITTGADLVATKTASSSPVPNGGILTYTLRVTNNGPDASSSLRVTDDLPTGFVVNGALPSGCGQAGQTVTCNVLSSIAAHTTLTLGTISGQVGASGGSTLTNAMSVQSTGSTPDPDTSNNTFTLDTPVSGGSDVRVTKSVSPFINTASSPGVVGGNYTFTLAVSYTGDDPQDLVLTDTVPAQLQITTASPFSQNGWNCSITGQTVTCTRASGGGGAGSAVSVGSVSIATTAISAGTTITNTANVSSSTPDPVSTNNSFTVSFNIITSASDLRANKTGPAGSVPAGGNFNWQISVANQGPNRFTGLLTMTDTVPIGVTVNSYTQSSSNFWSCAPAAPFTSSAGNNAITCTHTYTSGVPLAASTTISSPSVTINATAPVAGNYTNSMCVSSAASGANVPLLDPNSSNDCASHTATAKTGNQADVQVFKAASLATVPAGAVLTYTIEVVNAGPDATTNVTLTDSLASLINSNTSGVKPGLEALTLTANSASGASCASSVSSSTSIGVSCSFDTLPVCTRNSNCPVIQISIRPSATVINRTNTATAVSADIPDPNQTNNSASVTTTVTAGADMVATKVNTPNPVAAGTPLTYVLTAKNNGGPSTATNVTLTDTLPLDVTFVSATAAGGGTCATTPGAETTTTSANRTVQCSWASIGVGSQQTATLIVRPNTVTRGTVLTNSVTVASATGEVDPSNNTATSTATVTNPSVDLIANKSDNPDPTAVGDTVDYTLTATNNGPSTAETVQLVDTMPPTLLSFVSVTPPAGVNCPTLPAVGQIGGTLICDVGTLIANSSRSVVVRMLGTAAGIATNQLTVRSAESQAGLDSNTANNSVSENTTVREKADLEVVSKIATPATVALRRPFNYTIVVRNNGPGVGANTVVTDNLPAGLKLTGTPGVVVNSGSFSATTCTAAADLQSFSCNFGSVSNGAVATIAAPMIAVTAPAGGSYTNTATVATTSKDEVPANNSNSGPITVQSASIAGRVYLDSNLDSSAGAGEGLSGITVTLSGSTFDAQPVTLTTTTDASGNFSFAGLAASDAGGYTLVETQPGAHLDSKEVAGTSGGNVPALTDTGNSAQQNTIAAIILNDNTAATGYLFEEVPTPAISGIVYVDSDGNGHKDVGETTGIAGAVVTLSGTNPLGQSVSCSITTPASGVYAFTISNCPNLRPGANYTLSESLSGYANTGAEAGTGGGTASGAGVSPQTTTAITLNGTLTGYNFGHRQDVASIAGSVYVDANDNGLRDAGEPGIAGVTITLSGTSGGTTVTDASGAFGFSNLPPGTYTLTETQPAGFNDGRETAGTPDGTVDNSAFDATAAHNSISAIHLTAGSSATGHLFGERTPLGSLSGFVYEDRNNNGAKDAGEPGIAGVALALSGTNTLGQAVNTTATTAADGSYSFANLASAGAGGYTLVETHPAAYLDGKEAAGTAGGSAANTAFSSAAENNRITAIAFNAASGASGYLFGELQPATLAGAVYVDANANAARDAGEGLAGVSLRLTGTDDTGAAVDIQTSTGADGSYSFANLRPGNYVVTETQPAGYGNGATVAGSAGGTAGSDTVSAITLAQGASGTGYDFRETTASLSGSVYIDANDNAGKDAGEAGIAGVTITLTGTDTAGNAVSRTATTAADGSYSFTGLLAPNAAGYTLTETQPGGFNDGRETAGTPDGTVDNSAFDATAAHNSISAIHLTAGSSATGHLFGERTPLGSLSGFVYEDRNNNGAKDAGEPGIAGVALALSGTNTLGQAVNTTATTAADGSYSFANLASAGAGGYTLVETHPAAYLDGKEAAGTAGGSAANTAFSSAAENNRITAIAFNAASGASGYLFGELQPATLAGAVYVDANANAARDAGEGLAGVSLRLTGTDDTGAAVDIQTSTGADGSYSFANLRPGNYVVTETQPAGYGNGATVAGSAGGTAGSDTVSAITLAQGASGTGYDFRETTASLSGSVYIDANDNAGKDAGEAGIAGVTITLTGTDTAGNAVSRTATTAADGSYSFTGLLAPNAAGYTLTETQPGGFNDGRETAGTPDGTVDNSAFDATAAHNSISAIHLTAGSSATGHLFGERTPLGSLSGFVYEDRNNNGAKDAGEPGIAGVALALSGTNTLGQAVNTTATTAADGSYSFANLASAGAGGYTLVETHPAAYLDGKEAAGTAGGSAANTAFSSAAENNRITAIAFNAASGASGYLFGELQPATLAGAVYVDANANAARDAGEGLAGVSLRLTGTDDTGAAVDIQTSTGADGSYSFANLRPGNYVVTETQPAGYGNGATVAGSAGGTAGSDTVSAITLAQGASGTGYDFRETTASLSGSVYIDANDNAGKDAGEAGIAGVTITLTGTDTAGNAVSRTATTAADGSYSFTGLLAPNAAGYTLTETQPGGFNDGRETAGTPDGTVDNSAFDATAAHNSISAIHLTAGSSATGHLFGERRVAASLSGFVYLDNNDNGIREAGEPGIAGARIHLAGTDIDGNPVSRDATTAADGSYHFDNLPPSNAAGYLLTEDQPAGFNDGKDARGTAGGVLGNDRVSAISLAAAQNATGYTFGERPAIDPSTPASIAGRVWLDANHDRLDNDGAGSGREGWIVELLLPNGSVAVTAVTDASGNYAMPSVIPGNGYRIRFRHPTNGAVFGNPALSPNAAERVPGETITAGYISNLNVAPGANIVKQNLPLDPSGVTYDSTTRARVGGATVTLIGPPGFDPNIHLIGGAANQTQVTGPDGIYQFVLLPGAPGDNGVADTPGTYTLSTTAPAGYLPGTSLVLPPCATTLNVGAPPPDPALVQTSDNPPAAGATRQDPATCPGASAGLGIGADSTRYYLSFVLTTNASANVVNNHIPFDPLTGNTLVVTKTTPLVNVSRGDLVPYTITAANRLNAAIGASSVHDLLPPGFRYRAHSATLGGIANEPVVNGRDLVWSPVSFAARETKIFKLILVVGSGVGEGEYTNQAYITSNSNGRQISNTAAATVRVVPDATFDCADIIGKVFDDRNANGYQDQGEPGLADVRLATPRGLLVTTDAQGRFHVPCAEVPNADHGSNFVMKLDERTLPSGYRVTTENPRDVRVTRGTMVKLNFGAALHRVVRLQVDARAFEGSGNELAAAWHAQLASVIQQLRKGPSVLRLAYRAGTADGDLAEPRLATLAREFRRRWDDLPDLYSLAIETEVVR
ncbi:MAG: DUF11 domain-containing protein [Rhodocyclaceae bacterium]|nr:DUF11 domain-containing protein [Rhodocyclaceae bacterium]